MPEVEAALRVPWEVTGLPLGPAWGSPAALALAGADGQGQVGVMGGDSCWTHLLTGQLILHLFSPDPPVSSNITNN